MIKSPFYSFFGTLCMVSMAVLMGTPVKADTPPPLRFGPYLQQNVVIEGSPTGFSYVPPAGWYTAKAGWMEPLNLLPNTWFHQTYLEADGNTTISPYQADLGMELNLKPLHFLEGGVGYNRILYPYTLVGFVRPADSPSTWLPSPAEWRTREILDARKTEGVGADVFNFHADANAEIGDLQLLAGASRSLWDVDITDRDIIYDYRSGLLIKKQDYLSSLYAQGLLSTDPHFGGFTARGIEIRDQFTWATATSQSENLISGGFFGLRHGQNGERSYQGLDGLVGFWTSQPQLDGQIWWKHFQISLEWMWNIQILHLSEN